MSAELIFKPLSELAALLDSGQLSSVELVQAFADRIKQVDGQVKAFNSFDETTDPCPRRR